MKYKIEVGLLSLALMLFAVSAFFYSYQTGASNLAAVNWVSYPYQGVSIALVAFGSVLTAAAFVSYSKKGKNKISDNLNLLED